MLDFSAKLSLGLNLYQRNFVKFFETLADVMNELSARAIYGYSPKVAVSHYLEPFLDTTELKRTTSVSVARLAKYLGQEYLDALVEIQLSKRSTVVRVWRHSFYDLKPEYALVSIKDYGNYWKTLYLDYLDILKWTYQGSGIYKDMSKIPYELHKIVSELIEPFCVTGMMQCVAEIMKLFDLEYAPQFYDDPLYNELLALYYEEFSEIIDTAEMYLDLNGLVLYFRDIYLYGNIE